MMKVDLSSKSAPDNKVVATENINLVCNSIVIIHIDVDTLNLCFSLLLISQFLLHLIRRK